MSKNKAEKQTGPGKASGNWKKVKCLRDENGKRIGLIARKVKAPKNIVGLEYLSPENKAYVNEVLSPARIREALDHFARPACRPLDLEKSGLDITARNCRAADYIEKKIRRAENARFNRKMFFEDIGAGIFAAAGIALMLSIAYGLFYGAL